MKEGSEVKVAIHELVAALKDSAPKDSFNSFKTGLQQNWIFVIAIASVSLWLINGISDGKTSDQLQDVKITTNASNIAELTSNVALMAASITAQNNTQVQNNSAILSKIELIQKDIEIIKNK